VTDWRDERIAELEAESAAKDARIAELEAEAARIPTLEQQVTMLMKRVAELEEKLRQNSRNSHLPPSSDSPDERKQRSHDKSPGPRKRGGQPGHGGSRRELLPEDQVDEVVDLYPQECGNCWAALPQVPDPCATRHQQTEVPPVKPHTKEWRRHQVTCPHCGFKTRAAYDDKVIPSSPFGPRLMAIMAMITGIYHVSRRSAVGLLLDLLGVRVSLGALSAVEARVGEAVQPVVDEAWDQVRNAGVKHTDGTSWYQAGLSMALWTIATAAATVFKIVANSSKDTLRPLYGALKGILVSDRATSLTFWAMERRQICWAHLIRKFVSFSERDGPAGTFGRQLLDYAGIVFDYWHDYKDGKLTREQLAAWMAPVKKQVRELLDKAVAAGIVQVSGACADILEHEPALWTFVETDGVEPTNNHAEREIRAFVLWRKRSFGTQSARGNVFAANLMTVGHTARKQKRNVLALLTACCKAQRDGTPAPSLFDAPLAPATAAA
jgi:transposase